MSWRQVLPSVCDKPGLGEWRKCRVNTSDTCQDAIEIFMCQWPHIFVGVTEAHVAPSLMYTNDPLWAKYRISPLARDVSHTADQFV